MASAAAVLGDVAFGSGPRFPRWMAPRPGRSRGEQRKWNRRALSGRLARLFGREAAARRRTLRRR
jgi:hypothetical protein